jgi:hypothetical protein
MIQMVADGPTLVRAAPISDHPGAVSTTPAVSLLHSMVAVAQSGRHGSSCDTSGVPFGQRMSAIFRAIGAATFPPRPKTRYDLISEAMAQPFGGTAGRP